MGFVSMEEVLKKKLTRTRSTGKYNLLAISQTKASNIITKYERVIVFHFRPVTLERAGFKDGDKLDFQFDYKNKEGILTLASEGGRAISGGFKKGIFKKDAARRVIFPYFPGYGFPLAKGKFFPIPDKVIHIGNLRIVFNLKDFNGNFNYEVEEK